MKRNMAIVTWKEVREDVIEANKELGEIIDAINPGNDYKFINASYLYGDIFIKNGMVHFPSKNNELIPLTHQSLDKTVQKELFYSSMPLFLMLDKDNEIFIDTGSRIIPINLFHKGALSGTYEAMDLLTGEKSKPIWNWSAGSRSIISLPKITDKRSLRRVSLEYATSTTTHIKNLSDHWGLLRSIAQSKQFPQPWTSTILFFGEKWLTNKHRTKEWENFKHYLLCQIWRQAKYAIEKFTFNIGWEKFAGAISLRRLKPKSYLIDQVKHILNIAAGNFPAFKPMNITQEAAPIKELQKIVADNYKLDYLPTFMHICMLNDAVINPKYVYYSLSIPTVLEGSPLKKNSTTIINDLREIRFLIETIKNHLENKANTDINSLVNQLDIEYFHKEKDIYDEIYPSINIVNEDDAFLASRKMFPSLTFCSTSPFFSGCIRIGNNSKD